MRILMVGSDSKYAIEKPYLKYLEENKLVSAIELFTAQTMFSVYYQKKIINKIIYRLGLSRILHQINNKLKTKITTFSPDVVFIFKGMEIFPSTLKWIKARGIKLANYNPDNPFIFSGRGSGNKNITRSIKLFDLFMSYDRGICKKMETVYKVRSKLLPFGFDVSDELFTKCTKIPEKLKVCFVGNTDKYRLSFLNELAERGVGIDLYGMNWSKNFLHSNINYLGPVFEDKLWETLRAYRVQLNLMRIHNPNSHNMRSFEIAGIGGIQLSPDTPDHAAYFENGKDIFLYADIAECVAIIKKILSMNLDEANDVRLRSRKKSIENGYTYKDRAFMVAGYLKELVKVD